MRTTIKKESNEVFYFKGDLISLDKKFINEIISKCEKSNFKKLRYCFHKDKKSKVQEMIICHKKDYYVRPHKHIDKDESIFVIKGFAKAIFFDNHGKIKKIIKLGEINSKRAFYYKLNKKFFHMLLIESEYFIFHEVSNSSFKKNKTLFAKWSPLVKDLIFKKSLKKKIKVYENNI